MHGFGRYGVGHEPASSVKKWDICSIVVVWLIASEKSSVIVNCCKWRDSNDEMIVWVDGPNLDHNRNLWPLKCLKEFVSFLTSPGIITISGGSCSMKYVCCSL